MGGIGLGVQVPPSLKLSVAAGMSPPGTPSPSPLPAEPRCPCSRPCPHTLGMAPFSSTSRGAPLCAGRASPSSRQTQQKSEWRMPRLRGFWEAADFWSPEAGRLGLGMWANWVVKPCVCVQV